MPKKFDKSQFIGRFKEETNEHVSRLEKCLLALEKNPQDLKLIEEMMREAHTLKGSATMMGFKRIADLSHAFEDALAKINEGEVEPGDPHFELLLKVLDTIKPLLEDKLAWEDKGVAYPHVMNLEKQIEKMFRGGKAPTPTLSPREKLDPSPAGPALALAEPAAESVRVGVKKLDGLMNLVGELVTSKIRVDQRRVDLAHLASQVQTLPLEWARPLTKKCGHLMEEFDRTADEIAFVTLQLQGSVLSVRMLPLEGLFAIFPRAVRDWGKELAKQVELEISGAETELDKTMIEAIQDPLLHLLRNAVSHGIESREERKRLGKPEIGRIDLRAYTRGSQVVIEVEDDGRGIDPHQVKAAAIRRGLVTAEEALALSDAEALDLLYTPGFTTEHEVSLASGRGVGLNVVREDVTKLKGLVDLSSSVGQGTKFTLKLPLTLAVSLALFVEAYEEDFAIPLDHILETLRVPPEEIRSVEHREAIAVRDEIIPLIRLGDVLGLTHRRSFAETEKPVVIVGLAARKLAILVDRLKGKSEVVARSLGDHLKKVRHIAGSTILGTGEVVLILDIPSLIREASALPGLVRHLPGAEEKKGLRHSILVVEDSLITRDLERSILEAAGYQVGVAKDGEEALKRLAEEAYELVVTDITMPGMDGIELIRRMKQEERFRSIPTIVLSAKESEEDRKRGLETGASAYLLKSQFDQTALLQSLERLLP